MSTAHKFTPQHLPATTTTPQDSLPARALETVRRAIRWSAVTDAEWPRDTYFVRSHLTASVFIALALIAGLIHLIVSDGGQHPLIQGTWIAFLFAIVGIAPLTIPLRKGRIVTILRYDYVALVSVYLVGPWATLICALAGAAILAMLYRPSGKGVRFWRSILHWCGWVGGNVFVTVIAFAVSYPFVGNWAFLVAGFASMLEEMADRAVTFWAFGKFQCTWNCVAPAPHKLFIGPLGAWLTVVSPITGGVLGATLLLAFAGLIVTRIDESIISLLIRSRQQRKAVQELTTRLDSTATLLRNSTVPPKEALSRLISNAESFVNAFALAELWVKLYDRGDGQPGIWAWAYDDRINRGKKPIISLHRGDASPIAEAALQHAIDKNPPDVRGGLLLPFGDPDAPLGHILFARKQNSFALPYLATVVGHTLGQAIASLAHITRSRQHVIAPESIVDADTGALTLTAWEPAVSSLLRSAPAKRGTGAVIAVRAPLGKETSDAFNALSMPGAGADPSVARKALLEATISSLRVALANNSQMCSQVVIGVSPSDGTCYAYFSEILSGGVEALKATFSNLTLAIPVKLPAANATITLNAPILWAVSTVSVERSTAEALIQHCNRTLALQQDASDDTSTPLGITEYDHFAEAAMTGSGMEMFGLSQSPRDDISAIIAQMDRGRSDALSLTYNAVSHHGERNPVMLQANMALSDFPTLSHEHLWGFLSRNTDLLLPMWGHYAQQALQDAHQWGNGVVAANIKVVLWMPGELCESGLTQSAWTKLTKLATSIGVPLDTIVLRIDDPSALFDSGDTDLLNRINHVGVRIMTSNGAGLGHNITHIYGDLLEWSVFDEELTREIMARKSAAHTYATDLGAMAKDRDLNTKLVGSLGNGHRLTAVHVSNLRDAGVETYTFPALSIPELFGVRHLTVVDRLAS